MKLKLIFLCLVGALCATSAQTSSSSQTSAYSSQRRRALPASNESVIEQLRAAKDELSMLQLKYTDTHPQVTELKRRISELEKAQTPSSSARYATRLNSIVQRGASGPAGSIILSTAVPPNQIEELAEDLKVFNFILNRNLTTGGNKQPTEYRLGVAITLRDGRPIETTYIQDFGVLVKMHVPIAVMPVGEVEKKEKASEPADTEWEKARRALYGGGESNELGIDTGSPAAPPPYNEELVKELKKQIFESLKNAANLRHVLASEYITVVIVGAPTARVAAMDPLTGTVIQPEPARSTVMTIRVRKSDAEGAKSADDLEKAAVIATYFDTASGNSSTRGGYGAGAGLFGTGYSYETVPARR